MEGDDEAKDARAAEDSRTGGGSDGGRLDGATRTTMPDARAMTPRQPPEDPPPEETGAGGKKAGSAGRGCEVGAASTVVASGERWRW